MAALINLTVNSSTQQAQADLDNYISKSETTRAEVEKFRDSFDGKELDSFIDKTNRASAAVTATDGPLKGMQTEQKALRKEIQSLIKSGLDPQSDVLAEITARYDQVTTEVESLQAQEKKLKAEATSASKAASAQAKATQDLTDKQKSANTSFVNGIKHLATMALAYVSVQQAVSFMSSATEDATEYTKSIANINTMIEITDEDYQKLDDSITKVSEDLAISKSELTAGIYQAVSAGATSLSDAMDTVDASAILATGALIDNADAVDIVTTATNAYGKANMSASTAVDTFFTIVDQGKITGQELSSVIGKSISLYAQAKIPLDQLGAGISTLTKVGVPAAQTTTQLNAIIKAFIKPTTAMTKALSDAGYASGSYLLKTEGLTGGLEFLNTVTNGNIESMAELLPDVEGLNGAVALTADSMSVFNGVMEEFNNKQDAGVEASLKQTDGFAKEAFQIDQAKIKVENFRIELGEKFLPVMASTITHADDLAYALLGLVSGMVVFVAIAKGATIVNTLSVAFTALTAAMATNPIGAIAVVITAVLIPALVYMYKNWDTVSVGIQTSLAILKEKFDVVAIGFQSSWTIAIKLCGGWFLKRYSRGCITSN